MIHLRALPLPCPINALYRAMPIRVGAKGGAPGRLVQKMVTSRRARMRRDELVVAIWRQLGGRPQPITGDVQIAYVVRPRDARHIPDVDAYEKHLLDCLQHASVIANDKQVVQISKERLPPLFPGSIDVQISAVPT